MNREILSPEPKQYIADIQADANPDDVKKPSYSLVISRMELSEAGLVVPSDKNVSLPLGHRGTGDYKTTDVLEVKIGGDTEIHTVPLFDRPQVPEIAPSHDDDEVVFDKSFIKELLTKYAEGVGLLNVDEFVEDQFNELHGIEVQEDEEEYPGLYL